MEIKFNSLLPIQKKISSEINRAIRNVIESGWYILGPEVESFENKFAKYHGVKHAVGVANGTDAIELSLRSAGIGKGDEVVTVSHTAVPTITAIERAGAKPVFVDIDPDTFTMDVKQVTDRINSKTRAILPVHLYGHPADVSSLLKIAKTYKLLLVEDCAQAHGAKFQGKVVGTFGHIAAFSFYPTKNLGAYGDGGAIITNNNQFADKARRLRNYGQSSKYFYTERGMNSRLDEIQAVILKVKLRYLNRFNRIRRKNASLYNKLLPNAYIPKEREGAYHVYHLYVIRHPERDNMQKWLANHSIETLVHYPLPVHLQPAFADLKYKKGSLPVTEKVSGEILSLPMYIGLSQRHIKEVSDCISKYRN